jgi:translation initiation factor IF-3
LLQLSLYYFGLASQKVRFLIIESGQEDKKLEERIELLKAFLESMDFKKLRSQSEKYLVEGKKVKFVIRWKEGKPSYEMVVTEGRNF